MSALISDDVLSGMLAELAESVEVPPEGAASALAAIRSGGVAPVTDLAEVRTRRRKRVAAALGVAAAATLIVGVAVTHDGNSSGAKTAGATSAAPAYAAPSAAATAAAAAASPEQHTFSAQGGTTSTTGAATSGLAAPAAGLNQPFPEASPTRAPVAPAASGAPVPNVDADRVIRTGDVTLTVPKGSVPSTVTRLEDAATGLQGFLQDSNTLQADPKSGGVPTASVTLRVPAAQFQALLTRVQALGRVVSSTTTGKDVTAQYVDLAARLKALETSRSTYLTILSEAKSVNDTLSVQQRLDDIQQQIEQLQGQQNALGAQSDLATLTVEVSEPTPTPAPAPAAPKARSGLSQAFHTAGDRFRHGVESVIAALGTIALLLIATLGLLIIGRFGWRAYLRRTV